MVLYFVDMYIKLPQHQDYSKGFKLGEGIVAVAIFVDDVRLENAAVVVVEKRLLLYSEYSGELACCEVFSVLFHSGLKSSLTCPDCLTAAVYDDFTIDGVEVDEFFEDFLFGVNYFLL